MKKRAPRRAVLQQTGAIRHRQTRGVEEPLAEGALVVHQELALFVEAGLSPYQALHAATVEAARYFDMQGKFGTVTEGASADLVLLNANPLEDISNAKDINGVMLRGVWLDSEFIQNTTAEILASNEEELERLRALMAEAAATTQPE